MAGSLDIKRLGPSDLELMDGLLDLFADAFDDAASYSGARPDADYLRRLLASEQFFALVGCVDAAVAGGLVAYELVKFEQARSELYIYDLAVGARHRRRGIASALIGALQALAAARGCWVIFVQADHGDEPAIALYTKLGIREDVLHFDLAVRPRHD